MKKVIITLVVLLITLSASPALAEKKATLGQCISECVQKYNSSLADAGADEYVMDGFSGRWCVEFCKTGITDDSCYPLEDGCCNADYALTDPDCQVVELQLSEGCDTQRDLCAEGLACIPSVGGTTGTCGYPLPIDGYCNDDSQCLSGNCAKLDLPAGAFCTADSQCAGGTCNIAYGAASGFCAAGEGESLDGRCVQGTLQRGALCDVDDECSTRYCTRLSADSPFTCEYGCPHPNGSVCTSNSQCSSGLCGSIDPVTHFGVCEEQKIQFCDVHNSLCPAGYHCDIYLCVPDR